MVLSLPKVGFTSASFSLASALRAMGMSDAFDANAADFSGLCAHPRAGEYLHIADVLQKTMLGMAEKGVEAAAATGITLVATSASNAAPVTMVVNRPFVLSIIDIPTGAVLFLGHITDPTAP